MEHQTLITETSLFGCRLAALQAIVVALMTGTASHQLGQQTCEAELKVLEHRLKKLAQNVAKEGSLNAGGKFEWIDSVLVKVSKCPGKKVIQFDYIHRQSSPPPSQYWYILYQAIWFMW